MICTALNFNCMFDYAHQNKDVAKPLVIDFFQVSYHLLQSIFFLPNTYLINVFFLFVHHSSLLQSCRLVLFFSTFVLHFEKINDIYTTKIINRVCVCICPAMRFVMLRGTELKDGIGVGDGPTRFVGIFSKLPTWSQRSSRGQSALQVPYGYHIWWEEPLTRA